MFDFDENDPQYQSGAEDVIGNLEEGDPADQEMDGQQHAANIMNHAMQRIEEANLFKTLINTSIFAPNSARPEILDSVNGKIQQFAVEQLETLLGMRRPKAAAVAAELPFSESEISGLKMLLGNLTEVEVRVLKMLIGKVLKTDATFVAQATPERKPEINQIQAPTPQVKQIQAQPAQQQPQRRQPQQTQQQPVAAQQTPRKAGKRTRMGLTKPNAQTRVKAMPTAEQLIPTMQLPGVVASKEGVSGQAMQAGVMSVGDVVQRLTGGNVLAVDNSNPADAAMDGGGVDVNGRF